MAKSFAFHIRQQHYVCHLRPSFLIFCLFFISLFTYLGVWQLHRYHMKQALLAAYTSRVTERQAFVIVPAEASHMQTSALQFQPLKAEGHYRNDQTFLVQNRVYKDQLGYEVITPFVLSGDNKLLLIDRGWVPQSRAATLPVIPPVTGTQHISGYIKLANEYQFILGKNILNPAQLPIVIQKIDINDMSDATKQMYYPFIVRLDATQPHGYVRDWTISAVPPVRHLGYAVQWFLMAFVLMIAMICFCCERKK